MSSETDEKLSRTDHDTIIRLETKTDVLIGKVENLATGVNAQLLDHETRIRQLEWFRHDFKRTWKLVVGIATGIGTVIGIGAQLIIALFHR